MGNEEATGPTQEQRSPAFSAHVTARRHSEAAKRQALLPVMMQPVASQTRTTAQGTV